MDNSNNRRELNSTFAIIDVMTKSRDPSKLNDSFFAKVSSRFLTELPEVDSVSKSEFDAGFSQYSLEFDKQLNQWR